MSNYGVRDGHNVPVAALGENWMVRRRRFALVLTAIVIPARVQMFGRSLPLRLGIGQGNPHEVKHNTRAPTFVPTEDGTVSSISW